MAGKRTDLEQYYDKQTISGRIARLMKSKGYSNYDLFNKVGVPASTQTTSFPKNTWSTKNLEKISKHFNVSVEWLLKGDVINEIGKQPEPIETYGIKVYSKVAAGQDIERWNNEVATIDVYLPQLDKIKGKKYCFIIDGDSMRDRFRPGDYVICTEYENGIKPKDRDIVVIFYDTGLDSVSGNCKKFIWIDKNKGAFMLQPINSYYDPTYGTWDKVTRIFKVHWNFSPINYRNN